MADRRITYSREHRQLINELQDPGPFLSIADVLAFAAALGSRRADAGRRELPQGSGALGEPIRREIFEGKDYGTLIDLLAVHATKDPEVLNNTDEQEDLRATIFEEYANGGLHYLETQLKGQHDKTNGLLMVLNQHRTRADKDADRDDQELEDLIGLR